MAKAKAETKVDLVRDIPWAEVRPMPGQPREYFDQVALKELAGSIAAVGQLMPALVCPIADGKHCYELIDGQRRWHAIQMAGLGCLKARVVDEPDPERRFLLSVVSNFGREENHPMEVSSAIERLCRGGMTGQQVAKVLGKTESFIYQNRKLQNLHPDLADMLHPRTPRENRLTFTAAALLAGLPRAQQLAAYARVKAGRTNVTDATRDVLAEINGNSRTGRPRERVGGERTEKPRGRGPLGKYHGWHHIARSTRKVGDVLASFDDAPAREIFASRKPTEVEDLATSLRSLAVHVPRLLALIEQHRRS